MSSRTVLGILPSGVAPVAQFYCGVSLGIYKLGGRRDLFYQADVQQLLLLEEFHTPFGHVEMQRELVPHFLELRKCCQHIPHIVQTGCFLPRHEPCQSEGGKYLSVKLVFSWQNLLKSNMSLSMVSFICMCRMLVQRVSLSSSIAFFSSTPVAPRNSYLFISA